jgi:hypothetical protein
MSSSPVGYEGTGAVAPSIELRPVTELQRESGPGQKIMLVKTLRSIDTSD